MGFKHVKSMHNLRDNFNTQRIARLKSLTENFKGQATSDSEGPIVFQNRAARRANKRGGS